MIKFRAGKYLIPVTLTCDGDRIFIQFKFNRNLISEIKAMEGARWHGFDKKNPRKIWSIKNSHRNIFQIAYLQGLDPYQYFDSEIKVHEYSRPLYKHQKDMTDFILTKKHCIIAGELGVGKTLTAIEAMEKSGFNDWWYIAPKSVLRAIERELRIWKSEIRPRLMTYQGLVNTIKNWGDNQAPRGVIFDESSRIKNPNAQRSQAALALADGIRKDWDKDGYIILMSGAPAPRSPADWWHQCEVACPGFLKEGNQLKFKKRLAIIVEKESIAGGIYPSLESWLDDENKCRICGQYQNNHSDDHQFEPSKNEVSFLYERMKGLVLVKFKKDCLDLPEKIYKFIELAPSDKILNLARTIVAKASTVISGITLLRELSDGFQYQEQETGIKDCSVCHGTKKIKNPLYSGLTSEKIKKNGLEYGPEIIDCDGCNGSGSVKVYKRIAKQIDCPKEQALIDLLDEHIDIGRIIIYAGFTGSIDRCVQICQKCGWGTIRVDGRGWNSNLEGDLLDIFQDQLDKFPRVAFIAQPGAGGLGLTLTASSTIVYYSNDFNAESRIQSEDRIHRIGMDQNRGATIIDLVHLETDKLILDNLQKKRRLQSLTMGELKEALK